MSDRVLGPWENWTGPGTAETMARRSGGDVRSRVCHEGGSQWGWVVHLPGDTCETRSGRSGGPATAQRDADAAAVALGWTYMMAVKDMHREISRVLLGPSAPLPPIPTGPLCLMTATGARACAGLYADGTINAERRERQPLTDDPAKVTCADCHPIAARLTRERNRRAIDALLADDARRFPAFAEARRAAVIAAVEQDNRGVDSAALTIRALHAHERERPGPFAIDIDGDPSMAWLAAYERARFGSCLLGRPTGPRPPMPRKVNERDYLARWRP